jgi:hypothetical protein
MVDSRPLWQNGFTHWKYCTEALGLPRTGHLALGGIYGREILVFGDGFDQI